MIPKLYIKHYALGILLLAVLFGCTTEAERRQMRAGLDSINVLNRTDQPFTPDDVRPYIDFFDKEAKAFFTLLSSDSIHNDQLLAHYLLGRAYHEKGDAPMALESYQHAIDHADTTSAYCDYRQLSRVYAQMAELFYQQGLYREQLNKTKASVHYAWKGNDTLNALRNYEQEFSAYNRLCVTDSAIMVIEDVVNKYNQYGMPINSAISGGLAIRYLIDKGRFQEAKDYMNTYETLSGRFDSYGNIETGREIYYRSKGLYFLHTNKLDSAEYYFRKELRDGKDFNNQHSAALGLAELYHIQHIPDSTAKYYRYAYAMSDSLYSKRTTKDVERIQSMYDYTRHQRIANKEKEIASKRLIFIIILTGATIILLAFSVIAILKLKGNRQKRTILIEK